MNNRKIEELLLENNVNCYYCNARATTAIMQIPKNEYYIDIVEYLIEFDGLNGTVDVDFVFNHPLNLIPTCIKHKVVSKISDIKSVILIEKIMESIKEKFSV